MTDMTPPERPQIFEEQEQYPTPPELVKTPEEKEKTRKTRKKILLVLFGVIIVAMVVVGLFYLSKIERPEPPPPPTPTPLPTQTPSKMKQALERLESIVKAADPASEPFSPPPVDMEVEF